ncbi:MAG: histidinol dehydrogenase, partial [Deltaproteobacteria bacterium]
MRWVKSGTSAFRKTLDETRDRGRIDSAKVSAVVAEVLSRVRTEGDAALAEYTRRFDGFDPGKRGFAVSRREIDAAWKRVQKSLKDSLFLAASRIEEFHRRQVQEGFTVEIPGALVGQRVQPVLRAG